MPMRKMLIFRKVFCLAIVLAVISSTSGCNLLPGAAGNNLTNPYATTSNPEFAKLDASVINGLHKEHSLIVFDSSDDNSIAIKDSVIIVLNYMKISHDEIDISKSKSANLSSYDYFILTIEDLDKFSQLTGVISQVKLGSGLFFASRPAPYGNFFDSSKSILGIKNSRGFLNDVYGIKIMSDVLIKAKGFESNNNLFDESIIDADLEGNCTVQVKTYNDKPLLWTKKYGKGNIVLYNGVSLQSKINRGLMAGCISLLNDNFIYPVLNAKVFDLDDFPAPLSDVKYDSINALSMYDFVTTVWWPQMSTWSKQYNLKYTSFFIESYDNLVEPPFKQDDPEIEKFATSAVEELVGNSGEVGLHGYNHQPLALDGFVKYDLGYTPWKSETSMEQATHTATSWFAGMFKNYTITSYCAPSNILSPDGRKAVINSIPNLKVISGINIDEYYGMDLGVGDDGIVNLPRSTAGFIYDDMSSWEDYNSINMYGLLSHFVHADDVIDPDRSQGKSWDWMKDNFSTKLQYYYTNYPWLRPMTNSEAALEIRKYTALDPYIKYNSGSVDVQNDNFCDSAYYIMRSSGKPTGTGCEISSIDVGVYLIKATTPKFTINVN
jgi:hypothetical protein